MPPEDEVGGIAASHPIAELFSILVAPTVTGKEKNKIRMELIPVACWKINDVRFLFGSSFVLPDSRSEFVELSDLRKKHPGAPLSVFGHADPVSDDVFNKALSGHRAEAVYAVLTRNVSMWEKLYTATGSAEGWGHPAIQLMVNALGHATVKDFQTKEGLTPDGDPGPKTRAKLFPAYMDFLCPDKLDKSEFLGGGLDPKGKGDYQGCSEFNPAMVFSKAEDTEFKKPANKPERDRENGVSRRVMALLFRPGSQVPVAKWPCPRTSEGVEACRQRFFSDGETRRSPQAERREFAKTKDTFACRFYHRLVVASPCEGIDPGPVLDEVGPLLDQVAGPDPEAEPETEAVRSSLVPAGDKAAAAPADTGSPGLTGPGFGFVMVRKDKTVPRQAFRLRVDKPFDGQGTLTISPAGKIDFFKVGGGGKTPMNFTGENVFDGAALSSPEGVLLFGEGVTFSRAKNDITLTLTLSGGSKKVKPPANLKLTSVELTLDICDPPLPGRAPVPLPVPDKQTKGAKVFVQGDPPQARRAVLIVRPPKPSNLNHDLLLHTLSGRVELFGKQTPAKGETPLSGVVKIPSNSIGAGKSFFVEGRFPSKKAAEETYHLGINTGALGTLLYDSIGVTVVEQNWIGKLFYNRTWSHDTGQADTAVKEFLPNNKVELHGKAPGATTDALIATTFLDDNGKFEFKNVPELDSAIFRIFLEHKDNKVVTIQGQTVKGNATPVNLPDFKVQSGKVVQFDQPVDSALFKGKTGDINFNDFEVKHARFIMYCDAYVTIVFGHKSLLKLTADEADCPHCLVHVPEPKDSTSSVDGTDMFLLESDVQDRDVILHEYGHYIAAKLLKEEFLGYEFNDEPAATATHPLGSHPHAAEHYESAWTEAYGTFMSCALRDKATFKDSHEGPADTNPNPNQKLTDVTTTWGAHNEAPIQEALWRILKDDGVGFKPGFWTAVTADPKPTTIYNFFDNWKAKGCPELAKVLEAYKSRGMEFGFKYPEGADMFTAVAAPKSFDAAKKEFRTVDELFTAFGNVPGNNSGTKAEYEMEFYNRNKRKNAGALGAGSKAVTKKDPDDSLVITIKIVPGNKYIVPRRFQVKA